MLLWLAIAVPVLALAGSGALLAVRTLEAWRGFRAFTRATGGAMGKLAEATERTAVSADRLAAGNPALGRKLARLRVSRARLAVLTAAIDEVRDSVGRVTAVVPRK